jgi:hypothetical protein
MGLRCLQWGRSVKIFDTMGFLQRIKTQHDLLNRFSSNLRFKANRKALKRQNNLRSNWNNGRVQQISQKSL